MSKQRKSFWRTGFGRYVFNNLIALDQTWNARTGGDPDETISSRLGKIKFKHGGVIPWTHPLGKIIDAGLDVIDPGHSIDAIEHDEGKNSIVDNHATGGSNG